ncbi:MAG: thermopsin family protease [Candidatus Micrarchaeota archaeon]|nr:thermopsin family protease [Candidatus Micrarchaeota archaeon]
MDDTLTHALGPTRNGEQAHPKGNRVIWPVALGIISLFMLPFLVSLSFGGPSANNNSGIGIILKAMEPAFPKLQYMGNHINPYYEISSCGGPGSPSNGCAPIGLASYGIYGDANPKTYTIDTTILLGSVSISRIGSYNQQGMAPQNSSSLQLNGVLVVHDKDGTTKEYWIQHGIEFIGNTGTFTSLGSITNLTGNVSSILIINNSGSYCKQDSGYVVCTSGATRMHLPLSADLYMADFVVPGKGVLVYVGTTTGKDAEYVTPYSAYSKVSGNDSFTINDTNVSTAYFTVDGNDYIKSRNTLVAQDAELVFGGVGSGTETTFGSINATLSLNYYNLSSGSYMAFPSYYNFGFDTAESAGGINTNYSNGLEQVVSGPQKYVYLGK